MNKVKVCQQAIAAQGGAPRRSIKRTRLSERRGVIIIASKAKCGQILARPPGHEIKSDSPVGWSVFKTVEPPFTAPARFFKFLLGGTGGIGCDRADPPDSFSRSRRPISRRSGAGSAARKP